jgi:4-alpha-glucanotransferase
MLQTESFLDLPAEWREHLKALYNDYYYVRQDTLWREKAMEKLPALLGATDMLVCGEDLGMVPACVPGVMAELNIMSLGERMHARGSLRSGGVSLVF